MRFAWLREKSEYDGPVHESGIHQLIFIAYNVVYFVPLVLPIAKIIDYRTGIITFAIVIAVRTVLNWYRVNILAVEQAYGFPLRAP